jgi:polar amino acid transport system substrate-binding protein
MNSFISKLEHYMNQMGTEGYVYVGVSIIFIFLLIHAYSTAREKKKLRYTIDNYVKVFQRAFDLSKDALLILSDKYTVMYANPVAIELLGLKGDFLDKVLTPMPKLKRKRVWETLDICIEEKGAPTTSSVRSFPLTLVKGMGSTETEVNFFIDTVQMLDGNYSVISMHDLTQSNKHKTMEYKHRLTNLPNQLQALQDFPVLYSKVHLENNKIALVLLDFDNFTRLRSIIGYEQSNKIIIKFSKYLKTIVSELNISVYHTFDNNFLLTISNLSTLLEIENVIKEIQMKLASFYKMEDTSLHLTVSAGIAVYPDSGSTRKLLDYCYKALNKAQNGGDGKIELYLPEKNKSKFDELTLHNDMEGGLERGEFEVYYQPIVKADTHEIVSAEALIRWIHPTLGFIPPDEFIGLMEKTGFIVKLGQYILEEVLKQQRRWELFKFKPIGVSINVSMVEIATGEFVKNIEKRLQYHKINPALLKFEITEGMAMISEDETEKYFFELKQLGVSILLDDFGTGYTSFTYLKKFPADIIKIDKSLVDYILENEEDKRIVKAMIDLGHNLGMEIVVEGVENKEMVKILNAFGCDYIQGYYFSRPLPVFEFQKLLRT